MKRGAGTPVSPEKTTLKNPSLIRVKIKCIAANLRKFQIMFLKSKIDHCNITFRAKKTYAKLQ